MSVHQLVYISAAEAPLSDAELADILKKARTNNARVGVSGVLVYDAGSFFQVLEGPEGTVAAVFRKIEADPRHHRVVVLARQAVSRPCFAEWTMGFASPGHASLSGLPGFREFSAGALDATQLAAVKSSAFYLLEAFSVGRLRQFVSF